jgi:hypothetical protein
LLANVVIVTTRMRSPSQRASRMFGILRQPLYASKYLLPR